MNNWLYKRKKLITEILSFLLPRLGNEVINFKNVSKSFGDILLIDNLSFKLPPGGIIGVIGANGAVKLPYLS